MWHDHRLTLRSSQMSLLLSSDIARNKNVPKEYNMHVTNQSPANTFLFTEKDLPGYSSKIKGGAKVGAGVGGMTYPHVPPRPRFQDRGKQGGQAKYEKGKRWQPYYRKAVPSKLTKVHWVNKLPGLSPPLHRTNSHRGAGPN